MNASNVNTLVVQSDFLESLDSSSLSNLDSLSMSDSQRRIGGGRRRRPRLVEIATHDDSQPGNFSSYSFIHSGYFYSASTGLLLLRGAPETARILCQSFMPKRHRQLRVVKDLPKVSTWRLERDSNPRSFARMASNLPMTHRAPHEIFSNTFHVEM